MDRILLVTGGSRGIGAAICTLAARRGFKVAVNYNRPRRRGSGRADTSGRRALVTAWRPLSFVIMASDF